jgi:hypothetical protein
MDNKAQAGSVFRLMVDGIIGFAILLMILSALAYFDALSYESNIADFISKVESVVETPNGEIVSSDGRLKFREGTAFSSVMLRDITGYGASCFEFQSNLNSVDISSDKESIEFTQNANCNVYLMCEPNNMQDESCYGQGDDCCEINCIVSFGGKID